MKMLTKANSTTVIMLMNQINSDFVDDNTFYDL